MPSASRAEPEEVRPLGKSEFEQIRRLAYETFGLDLKVGKEELVSARLRKLVRASGAHSYLDYYRHVVEDRTGEALASMIDALATNHTAFLREPEHFRFLKEQVAPGLQTRNPIEIWSAACATGEEVWTLAFLMEEALPGRNVRIFGTDISNKGPPACPRPGTRVSWSVARANGQAGSGWLRPGGRGPSFAAST